MSITEYVNIREKVLFCLHTTHHVIKNACAFPSYPLKNIVPPP